MSRRHVILCQRQFIPQILAGTKLHTIRPHRVREIRAGDVLDLRAWTGLPYRSKQRKIREVLCVGVAQIEVDARRQRIFLFNPSHYYPQGGYVIDEIAFAQRDGFTYTADLFAWFLKHHGPVFTGQLIEWRA